MNHKDNEAIIGVHRLAFDEEEGPLIAKLAEEFLALPETISVSAKRDGNIVGNVLFTPFGFCNHPEANCYLLAPLAVLPEVQGSGVGRELMETGIAELRSVGADAIFVLGVPTFYPKFGFVPTDKPTPYPDLLTVSEPWMAHELRAGSLGRLHGKTVAVDPIMQPHFWGTSDRE